MPSPPALPPAAAPAAARVPAPTPTRRGSILLEQLLALVILGIGLLSLGAAISALQRALRLSATRNTLSAASASALETATTGGCAPASGADTAGTAVVTWSRTGAAPAVTLQATASDNATALPARTLTTVRSCRPGE